jgi:hypothetical protein
MATLPLGPDSARLNPAHPFAGFDRRTLASAVEVLVAVIDTMDGDPDLEPDGDEQDGNFAEDEDCAAFATMARGPGCIEADPDDAVDDKGCDDINDDREEESSAWPAYGIDQSAGPLPGHLWRERV